MTNIMFIQAFGLLCIFFHGVTCDCRLQPISLEYYYGVDPKNHADALHCCNSKGMRLADVNTEQQRHRIRNSLLTESFLDKPIGPVNGVHVATSQNVPEVYPQSSSSSKQDCPIAFLSSPKEVKLKVVRVSCDLPFRYLCEVDQKQQFDTSTCSNINYTELIEDTYLYSDTKLHWRYARDCCEVKGGELVGDLSSSQKEDILMAFVSNAIMPSERNSTKELIFWTGGFKKFDQSHFTWSNADYALIPNATPVSEFCIKGVAKDRKLLYVDAPCEIPLNSICKIKVPKKCTFVNMKPISVQNSFRTYFYSDSYKLPWSEAVLCCRDKGLELLSVVSPTEGKRLAATFQASDEYEYRHQGLSYGIWTSGRQTKTKAYEFVSARTKTNLFDGDSHFIQGDSSGTCLQYVVDVRNSFVLHKIPCKSIRSFVCEKPESLPFVYDVAFREMGNMYFLGSRKIQWKLAREVCSLQRMNLLQIRNAEEETALTPVLKYIISDTNSTGLWAESGDETLPTDFNPVPYELKKTQTAQGNVQRTSTRTTNNICPSVQVAGNQLSLDSTQKCNDTKSFICEKEDKFYGMCNSTAFTRLGNYLFNTYPTIWKEARKCCKNRDKILASINPTQTSINNFIFKLLEQNKLHQPFIGAWTSGTNIFFPKKWTWSDAHRFVPSDIFFNNYMSVQSESTSSQNQCLEMFADKQSKKVALSHDDCNLAKPFLCEAPESNALKSCQNIRFEKLRRSAFYYATSKVKWLHALECCQQRGMTLAEIHTSPTNENLNKYIQEIAGGKLHADLKFGVWIGLSSETSDNEGSFGWLSSKPMSFGQWYDRSNVPPTGGVPQCVAAHTMNTLKWKPTRCSEQLRFLCQKIQS